MLSGDYINLSVGEKYKKEWDIEGDERRESDVYRVVGKHTDRLNYCSNSKTQYVDMLPYSIRLTWSS